MAEKSGNAGFKEATKHFKELSNRGFGPDVK